MCIKNIYSIGCEIFHFSVLIDMDIHEQIMYITRYDEDDLTKIDLRLLS